MPLATTFDKGAVDVGYTGQVEPHLGSTIGTAGTATHGFCIGGWLTSNSTTKADTLIHYTDPSSAAGSGGGSPPTSVQINNYATAFRLAHGEQVSRQIRNSTLDRLVEFSTFTWIESRIRVVTVSHTTTAHGAAVDEPWRVVAFALERRTATAVLRMASRPGTIETDLQLPELSRESVAAAWRDGGPCFPTVSRGHRQIELRTDSRRLEST